MKNLFALVILILSIHAGGVLASPKENKSAPPFSAKLLNKNNFSLESAKDQVVIIHFWSIWCSACHEEMPALNRYYQKHQHQGLRMIAVSMDETDEDAKVKQYLQPFAFDASLERESSYEDYGRIWRLPMTFIIDKKGILRKDANNIDGILTEEKLEQMVTPLFN